MSPVVRRTREVEDRSSRPSFSRIFLINWISKLQLDARGCRFDRDHSVTLLLKENPGGLGVGTPFKEMEDAESGSDYGGHRPCN